MTGGPTTPSGKAVVRWNATRHGISSPQPVVPGLEKQEDWESYRDGIMESLSPVGHLEITLAERVALLSWRLHRVTRYETETIALAQERVEWDIHESESILRSHRALPWGPTHPEDVRLEAKYRKATHNALKRLPSLKAGTTMKGEDASAIVVQVLVAARDALGEEIEAEELDLPGVPEGAAVEDLPSMKVEDVRGCVQSIARAAGEDPDALLVTATEMALRASIGSKMDAERTEGEIGVMRRERILPDDKTLEKISRYEAHLFRQLYQALHELENLQKYRTTGEGTPLARVDVQGLSKG
jgi:hypothetical protein